MSSARRRQRLAARSGRRQFLYDRIGTAYSPIRTTEPRIAQQIWTALGDAQTVLNVGAGTGSYEPTDREVTAVEPSAVMRAQRPPTAPICIAAFAEELPFSDDSFDAAMAIHSDHHWNDPIAGLRELRRVARRVVVLLWDESWWPRFWLVRDYLPEIRRLSDGTPSFRERVAALDARTEVVPIPWDCTDGFFHAYWRRPQAYLDARIRAAASVWDIVGRKAEDHATRRLAADLRSGRWLERNGEIIDLNAIDLGARLLVTEG